MPTRMHVDPLNKQWSEYEYMNIQEKSLCVIYLLVWAVGALPMWSGFAIHKPTYAIRTVFGLKLLHHVIPLHVSLRIHINSTQVCTSAYANVCVYTCVRIFASALFATSAYTLTSSHNLQYRTENADLRCAIHESRTSGGDDRPCNARDCRGQTPICAQFGVSHRFSR